MSLIKYADDTLVLEKLQPDDQSSIQEVLTTLNRWCDERDLILIETKIKEILFSNARDDSDPPTLTIQDTPLQRVTAYKYLGITISNKLKFQRNTKILVESARKKLFMMRKLRFLGTSEKLANTCYKTFIESGIMQHLPVIYQHMTEKEEAALEHITKMACKLLKTELPSLLTTVTGCIKAKALRMVGGSSSPVLTLANLLSGRFETL